VPLDDAVEQGPHGCLVTDVARDEFAPHLSSGRLPGVVRDVHTDESSPLGGEPPHGSQPDPAPRPGNNGNPPFQPPFHTHGPPLSTLIMKLLSKSHAPDHINFMIDGEGGRMGDRAQWSAMKTVLVSVKL
jgi:hypothetical protein